MAERADFFVSFGSNATSFGDQLSADLRGARAEIQGLVADLTKVDQGVQKRTGQSNAAGIVQGLDKANQLSEKLTAQLDKMGGEFRDIATQVRSVVDGLRDAAAAAQRAAQAIPTNIQVTTTAAAPAAPGAAPAPAPRVPVAAPAPAPATPAVPPPAAPAVPAPRVNNIVARNALVADAKQLGLDPRGVKTPDLQRLVDQVRKAATTQARATVTATGEAVTRAASEGAATGARAAGSDARRSRVGAVARDPIVDPQNRRTDEGRFAEQMTLLAARREQLASRFDAETDAAFTKATGSEQSASELLRRSARTGGDERASNERLPADADRPKDPDPAVRSDHMRKLERDLTERARQLGEVGEAELRSRVLPAAPGVRGGHIRNPESVRADRPTAGGGIDEAELRLLPAARDAKTRGRGYALAEQNAAYEAEAQRLVNENPTLDPAELRKSLPPGDRKVFDRVRDAIDAIDKAAIQRAVALQKATGQAHSPETEAAIRRVGDRHTEREAKAQSNLAREANRETQASDARVLVGGEKPGSQRLRRYTDEDLYSSALGQAYFGKTQKSGQAAGVTSSRLPYFPTRTNTDLRASGVKAEDIDEVRGAFGQLNDTFKQLSKMPSVDALDRQLKATDDPDERRALNNTRRQRSLADADFSDAEQGFLRTYAQRFKTAVPGLITGPAPTGATRARGDVAGAQGAARGATPPPPPPTTPKVAVGSGDGDDRRPAAVDSSLAKALAKLDASMDALRKSLDLLPTRLTRMLSTIPRSAPVRDKPAADKPAAVKPAAAAGRPSESDEPRLFEVDALPGTTRPTTVPTAKAAITPRPPTIKALQAEAGELGIKGRSKVTGTLDERRGQLQSMIAEERARRAGIKTTEENAAVERDLAAARDKTAQASTGVDATERQALRDTSAKEKEVVASEPATETPKPPPATETTTTSGGTSSGDIKNLREEAQLKGSTLRLYEQLNDESQEAIQLARQLNSLSPSEQKGREDEIQTANRQAVGGFERDLARRETVDGQVLAGAGDRKTQAANLIALPDEGRTRAIDSIYAERRTASLADAFEASAARQQDTGTNVVTKLFGAQGPLNNLMRSTGQMLVRSLSGSLVFGAQNVIGNLASEAIDTEATFVQVSDALEQTGRASGELRTGLVGISTDLGIELQDVYTTAASLTGVFHDVADIEFATRVVSQLELISRGALSAQEAVRSFVSIANAYELEGPEGIARVGDVATALQNTMSVNVEDTVEGVSRVSEVTKSLGIDLEQAATFIGVIGKGTGQTGSAAAEQFGRVLSRVQSARGQSVLTEAGIGTPEQFINREYGAIIVDLATRYDGLTKAQQQSIESTLGSGREFAAFGALVGDQGKFVDSLSAAYDSEGLAAERAAKLTQNLDTQLRRLGSNFQALAEIALRSGLFNALGLGLSIVNEVLGATSGVMSRLLDLIDRIPGGEVLKNLVVGFVGLNLAIAAVQRTIASLGGKRGVLQQIGLELGGDLDFDDGGARPGSVDVDGDNGRRRRGSRRPSGSVPRGGLRGGRGLARNLGGGILLDLVANKLFGQLEPAAAAGDVDVAPPVRGRGAARRRGIQRTLASRRTAAAATTLVDAVDDGVDAAVGARARTIRETAAEATRRGRSAGGRRVGGVLNAAFGALDVATGVRGGGQLLGPSRRRFGIFRAAATAAEVAGEAAPRGIRAVSAAQAAQRIGPASLGGATAAAGAVGGLRALGKTLEAADGRGVFKLGSVVARLGTFATGAAGKLAGLSTVLGGAGTAAGVAAGVFSAALIAVVAAIVGGVVHLNDVRRRRGAAVAATAATTFDEIEGETPEDRAVRYEKELEELRPSSIGNRIGRVLPGLPNIFKPLARETRALFGIGQSEEQLRINRGEVEQRYSDPQMQAQYEQAQGVQEQNQQSGIRGFGRALMNTYLSPLNGSMFDGAGEVSERAEETTEAIRNAIRNQGTTVESIQSSEESLEDELREIQKSSLSDQQKAQESLPLIEALANLRGRRKELETGIGHLDQLSSEMALAGQALLSQFDSFNSQTLAAYPELVAASVDRFAEGSRSREIYEQLQGGGLSRERRLELQTEAGDINVQSLVAATQIEGFDPASDSGATQLADIQTAAAEQQRRIGELFASRVEEPQAIAAVLLRQGRVTSGVAKLRESVAGIRTNIAALDPVADAQQIAQLQGQILDVEQQAADALIAPALALINIAKASTDDTVRAAELELLSAEKSLDAAQTPDERRTRQERVISAEKATRDAREGRESRIAGAESSTVLDPQARTDDELTEAKRVRDQQKGRDAGLDAELDARVTLAERADTDADREAATAIRATAIARETNGQVRMALELADAYIARADATGRGVAAEQAAQQRIDAALRQQVTYDRQLRDAVLATASAQTRNGQVQAANQLTAANNQLGDAQADGDPLAIETARAAVAQAENNVVDYDRQLRDAVLATASASSRNEGVRAANELQAANNQMADAIANDSDPLGMEAARQAIIAAERGVADYATAVADSETALAIAVAEAAGDTVEAARLRVVDANNKLGKAQQTGDTQQINVATAEQVSAEANQRDVVLNDQLDSLRFDREMGRITANQQIASLQQLLAQTNLTRQQRRDIELEIKRLQTDLTGQLAGGFSIPDAITLPTAYEVRRSLAIDPYLAAGNQALADLSTLGANMTAVAGGGFSPAGLASGGDGRYAQQLAATALPAAQLGAYPAPAALAAPAAAGATQVVTNLQITNHVADNAQADIIARRVIAEVGAATAAAVSANQPTPALVAGF